MDGVPDLGWRINFRNTWTGAVSNVWENPANWGCAVTPDPHTHVVINTGNVVISSNVIVRTILVMPGATLTVTTGNTLTITNQAAEFLGS